MTKKQGPIATGWKAPLEIRRLRKGLSGAAYLGAGKIETLSPREAVSVNDFGEVRDYKTFKKFVAKYGLPMLVEGSPPDAYLRILVMASGRADDVFLRKAWGELEGLIKKWQGELQALMKARLADPARFKRVIRPYLAVFTRKEVLRQGDTLIEVRHYEGILEQCAYKIATTDLPIIPCETCGKLFIQTKDTKKYCSRYCKYLAGREGGKVGKKRAVLLARLNRTPAAIKPKGAKEEAREAIKKGRTLPELEKVEQALGLGPRPRGPQPEKNSNVSEKKGAARHGGTH
jgi:ssDNA-binding Zn-finger/Zn-ribbon topoisomerase 1